MFVSKKEREDPMSETERKLTRESESVRERPTEVLLIKPSITSL